MSKAYCPECGKQGCWGAWVWLILILAIGCGIGILLPIDFLSPIDFSSPDTGPGSQPPSNSSSPGEPARNFVEDNVIHIDASDVAIDGITFKNYTRDDLLDALEWVESKGDPWAVGDNGKAVGSFQIHEIFFNDVKRIQLKQPATFSWSACMFRLKDRYDAKKSREMVSIYLKYYGGTFEEMARKVNGGPNGHNKESTKAYWLKVKARMEAK